MYLFPGNKVGGQPPPGPPEPEAELLADAIRQRSKTHVNWHLTIEHAKRAVPSLEANVEFLRNFRDVVFGSLERFENQQNFQSAMPSDLSQQVSLYAVGSNALRSIALRFIGLRDITVYGLRFIGLRSDRIAVGSLYGPLDGLSLDGLSLYDPIYKK